MLEGSEDVLDVSTYTKGLSLLKLYVCQVKFTLNVFIHATKFLHS